MELMIDGETLKGEIHLVKVGQSKRRGMLVQEYEYEAQIDKGAQKITKRFKKYDDCYAFLISYNKGTKK